MTSLTRSLQDSFFGKNSSKAIKYSQSYNVVCQLALLGGKGLSKQPTTDGEKDNNLLSTSHFDTFWPPFENPDHTPG